MTSAIERLDSEVKIPYDEEALRSEDPARLAEYVRELVKTLQELLEKITTITNYGVDLFDGEALYSKLKSSDGQYPLGTWRLKQVDDNWRREYLTDRTENTWTYAGEFEHIV